MGKASSKHSDDTAKNVNTEGEANGEVNLAFSLENDKPSNQFQVPQQNVDKNYKCETNGVITSDVNDGKRANGKIKKKDVASIIEVPSELTKALPSASVHDVEKHKVGTILFSNN